MTEKKKKRKKLKSLIRFHSANKINNYYRGGEKGKKKKRKENESHRTYIASQNIRIINVFLESLVSLSFLSLGVTVHLTSLGFLPTL